MDHPIPYPIELPLHDRPRRDHTYFLKIFAAKHDADMRGIMQCSLAELVDHYFSLPSHLQPWEHGHRSASRVPLFEADEWESWLYVLKVRNGPDRSELIMHYSPC